MTIAQAKHPHPRRLEGTALLVRSTHSYRFATIRFATPRNAPFDRSVGLPDRPFGFGQPTARPIRFGSPWTTINTRDRQKPDRSRGADRNDDGEAIGDRDRRGRDDPRGGRADLRHDWIQEQVLDPPHGRGLFPLRGTRAQLGERERRCLEPRPKRAASRR
jgi:hypothetical protein